MPITPEVLDGLLKDYKTPEDMPGSNGLLQQLAKALVERALEGEMTHHPGYPPRDVAGDNSGNSRNAKSKKTITGKRGRVEVEAPRDRKAEFEPPIVKKGQLVKKGQRRFDGFDDKIISMYARGMSCRIRAHLEEIYSVEVSPDLISTVTDAVIDEVRRWQRRPLVEGKPGASRARAGRELFRCSRDSQRGCPVGVPCSACLKRFAVRSIQPMPSNL
jgi:putative transposase